MHQEKPTPYNIVLEAATIIFNEKIDDSLMRQIVQELEEVDGIWMAGPTELSEGYEIEAVTKFGDDPDFWNYTLPKIRQIINRHLRIPDDRHRRRTR